VSFSRSAPTRHPEPDFPESDFPASSPPSETAEQRSSILVYLRLLWNHRRMLLLVSLYALLASTAIALLIPARYKSTARLMPPDNQSNFSGLGAMAAAATSLNEDGLQGIASDFLGLKSTSDIFVGVLGSRTVQDDLIQRFNLKSIYRDKHMEDARTDLTAHTDISVDRKSQIIEITVTDQSPQRATAMCQAYVEELNRLVVQLSTSAAHRERVFLEGRLQDVNRDLEAAEKDFSHFASKNTAIDVKEQGKAMVDAAAVLQGQLIAAESELEGLRQIYTDNNARVRSLRARVDELKLQLDKIAGKGEDISASSDDQQQDSSYPSIRRLPLLGVTYADLYRQTQIQETVLKTLTKEYELAKVQEAKEIPTVKVLDPASVPDKRSFPPRLLVILLGTFFSFSLGVIYVVESANWKAMDPKDPKKQFATEIWVGVKARAPWIAKNGAGAEGSSQHVSDEPESPASHGDKSA
jgi:uncharacterized protein involved in exopolysaccharide biosynthesis